ncbi:MAG TPA: hypothetical protein DHV85_09610 [Candidatus Accumulibacter sp.]|nr:hypothetical protein [Accumulibacter sp.]
MLYKIVPFLVWSHLQNLGRGRVLAPNMNKVIAGKQIDGQMYAHLLALLLLFGAVLRPTWFAYPAGLALLAANGWLLHNIVCAVRFYRGHRLKIEAQTTHAAIGR